MILLFIIFIFPIIVAFLRGHRNAISITLVNIFFGLTVIGYLIALIWCFSDNCDAKKKNKDIKDWHFLIALFVLFVITFSWYNILVTRILNQSIKMIEVKEYLIER